MPSNQPLNIAVIGSGISGLSCAWLLSQRHRVRLFEKDDRFGGHSNTLELEHQGDRVAVDTGFIVFNPPSYPNLVALFEHLRVPVIDTDMSFSVSVDQGRLEYSGTDLNGLFAQRTNLVKPSFWRMLMDIHSFYNDAGGVLAEIDDRLTLGQLLDDMGLSREFRDNHLLPMGAAIWSTPADQMLAFPAKSFLRFCSNHGLLQVRNRPQWKTVSGGSRVYVNRLLEALEPQADTNCGVRQIRRQRVDGFSQVVVTDWQGREHQFDQVVLACHADQALQLLRDADPDERQLLGAFKFERNRTLLHSDTRLMPQRRRAWSSWNYLQQQQPRHSPQGEVQQGSGLSVSYWMNRLQQLPESLPLFVSLNPFIEPDPDKVHAAFLYDHPTFDLAALQAQSQLWSLQGRRNTWFCGAWFGYGFHEDGLQSGLAVAEALGGLQRPWQVPGMYDRLQLPDNWRHAHLEQKAA